MVTGRVTALGVALVIAGCSTSTASTGRSRPANAAAPSESAAPAKLPTVCRPARDLPTPSDEVLAPPTVSGPGDGGWRRGSLVFNVMSLVRGHGIFVVAGGRTGGVYSGSGYVRTSADAVHWADRVDEEGPFATIASIDGAVVTPSGFTAWGSTSNGSGTTQLAVWTAGPTGEHWTKQVLARGAVLPTGDVVPNPTGGWLAVADGKVLRSLDAAHWTATTVTALSGSPSRLHDDGHGGFVAFLDSGDGHSAIWVTSPHGVNWTRHADIATFGRSTPTILSRDAQGLITFVAANAPTCTAGTLWRSTDRGITWHPDVTVTDLHHGVLRDLVATSDGGLLATGDVSTRESPSRVGAWLSSDHGHTWTSLIPDSTFYSWGTTASSLGDRVAVLGDTAVIEVEYGADKTVQDTLTKKFKDLRETP